MRKSVGITRYKIHYISIDKGLSYNVFSDAKLNNISQTKTRRMNDLTWKMRANGLLIYSLVVFHFITELRVSVSRSLQPNPTPTPTPGSALPLVGAGPAASSGGRGPGLARGALPARDPRRGTVTSNGEGSGLKLPSVQPTASSLLSGPAQGPAREGSATVDGG